MGNHGFLSLYRYTYINAVMQGYLHEILCSMESCVQGFVEGEGEGGIHSPYTLKLHLYL